MQFAIQARLIERHGNIVIRNETRLNSASALSDAVRTARTHAADGFTVWIYEVLPNSGGPPTYVPVDTLRPEIPARTPMPGHGGSRSGGPGGATMTGTEIGAAAWPRRAVVTGAAGFIGSHLVDALLGRGTEVIALDRRGPERRDTPAGANGRVRWVVTDLLDGTLTETFDGTDTVFHLAGVPGVLGSWGTGFGDYAMSNVLGTHEVIRACEEAGVRRLVFASSSSVYGSAAGFSSEVDPTAPRSPYGATKLAAEHLCLAHARRVDTDLSVTVLRYFTVYGPRQRPDMAVHRILTSALIGAPFELYGDGSQRREFTYVEDVVDATITAAALPMKAAVINIGGGSSVEMTEVLALAAEVTARPVRVVHRDPRPGDVAATAADLTVARTVLGYRPMVGLREGLHRQAAAVAAELRCGPAAVAHDAATTGAPA